MDIQEIKKNKKISFGGVIIICVILGIISYTVLNYFNIPNKLFSRIDKAQIAIDELSRTKNELNNLTTRVSNIEKFLNLIIAEAKKKSENKASTVETPKKK